MKRQETDDYSLSISAIYEKYQTSAEGLSDDVALARLERDGKNRLRQKPKKTIWKMLVEQLSDVMVLILIAAEKGHGCDGSLKEYECTDGIMPSRRRKKSYSS